MFITSDSVKINILIVREKFGNVSFEIIILKIGGKAKQVSHSLLIFITLIVFLLL